MRHWPPLKHTHNQAFEYQQRVHTPNGETLFVGHYYDQLTAAEMALATLTYATFPVEYVEVERFSIN